MVKCWACGKTIRVGNSVVEVKFKRMTYRKPRSYEKARLEDEFVSGTMLVHEGSCMNDVIGVLEFYK